MLLWKDSANHGGIRRNMPVAAPNPIPAAVSEDQDEGDRDWEEEPDPNHRVEEEEPKEEEQQNTIQMSWTLMYYLSKVGDLGIYFISELIVLMNF